MLSIEYQIIRLIYHQRNNETHFSPRITLSVLKLLISDIRAQCVLSIMLLLRLKANVRAEH